MLPNSRGSRALTPQPERAAVEFLCGDKAKQVPPNTLQLTTRFWTARPISQKLLPPVPPQPPGALGPWDEGGCAECETRRRGSLSPLAPSLAAGKLQPRPCPYAPSVPELPLLNCKERSQRKNSGKNPDLQPGSPFEFFAWEEDKTPAGQISPPRSAAEASGAGGDAWAELAEPERPRAGAERDAKRLRRGSRCTGVMLDHSLAERRIHGTSKRSANLCSLPPRSTAFDLHHGTRVGRWVQLGQLLHVPFSLSRYQPGNPHGDDREKLEAWQCGFYKDKSIAPRLRAAPERLRSCAEELTRCRSHTTSHYYFPSRIPHLPPPRSLTPPLPQKASPSKTTNIEMTRPRSNSKLTAEGERQQFSFNH